MSRTYPHDATNNAIRYLVSAMNSAEEGEEDTVLMEKTGDYVDLNLGRQEIRDVCAYLVSDYGRRVDVGTLHKWGRGSDLEADLDLFASSLACALLHLAATAAWKEQKDTSGATGTVNEDNPEDG